MSKNLRGSQPESEDLQANRYAKLLPRLEGAKSRLRNTGLRLDYELKSFDDAMLKNWSIYFRVVNTRTFQASSYYIINLGSRPPLITVAVSLEGGTDGHAGEVWSESVQSHDDITDEVLSKLVDCAAWEARQR